MNDSPDTFSRSFPAEVEALTEAQAFIEETLEGACCPMKTMMQIAVCFEELFANVALYAYPEGGGSIDVEISCTKDAASITISDSGIPFNPLEREDPDITLSAEERQIGGLGIYMTKKLMDSFTYERTVSGNRVTVEKKFL